MPTVVNPNFGQGSSRARFKQNYLKFQVDFSDINKEFGLFIKALGKDLSQELKRRKTADKIADRSINSLKQTKSTTSGRVRAIMDALKHRPKYGVKSSGSGKIGRFNVRQTYVSVANVKHLDRQTQISALDRAFPPRHNAPFAGNPLKKTGQESKNQKRNALWRIFEYPTKASYPIMSRGPLSLRYTTSKDGNSQWHYSRSVTWKGTGRNASSMYYLLNSARQVYKGDQLTFTREVKRGVKKIIETKTRFRK